MVKFDAHGHVTRLSCIIELNVTFGVTKDLN
jgi:hypothetical protein